MRENSNRYATISIILHWTILILIIANATIGGWMEESEGAEKLQNFQLHKSVGLTILTLSLIRLGWRIGHPFPAFPGGMPQWERIVARSTHILFYVLMIGAPLLGWAAASAKGIPATSLYGVLPAPNLPLAESESFGDTLGGAHKLMVKLIYVTLAVHVLGALKHHFFDRDQILHRMAPIIPRMTRKDEQPTSR